MAASGGAGGLGRSAGDEEQPRGRGAGQRCHGRDRRNGTRRSGQRHEWQPAAPCAPPGFLLSWLFLIGQDGMTLRPDWLVIGRRLRARGKTNCIRRGGWAGEVSVRAGAGSPRPGLCGVVGP